MLGCGSGAGSDAAAGSAGGGYITLDDVSFSMGFGKDGKGVIIRESVTITLGALGAGSIILSTAGNRISGNLGEDFRIIKTEYVLASANRTSDEGTVHIGIANGELTAAEVGEAISPGGPTDRNDRLNQERAERAVWLLGTLGPSTDISTGGGSPGFVLPYEKTLRWTFSNPEAWDWFALNVGPAALTAGTIVDIRAKHFGVWVT